MPLHQSSGKWKTGFLLAFTTASLWGFLPIALKNLLPVMDAYTITWYRFLAALVLLGIVHRRKHGFLPKFPTDRTNLVLLGVAFFGLAGNYLFYLLGLQHLTPSAAQVVVQLAPVLMLLGGLIIFREGFTWKQWVGFLVMLTGLLVFFNQRLDELFLRFTDYTLGVVLVVVSAVVWAGYSLAQKQLLMKYSSESILWLLYVICAVFFGIFASPSQLFAMGWFHLGLLAFTAINTVLAYGAFAEALEHWEASRVSAVLAIVPLLTVGATKLCAWVWPENFKPEHLSLLSIGGAALVVIGSLSVSLSRRKGSPNADPG